MVLTVSRGPKLDSNCMGNCLHRRLYTCKCRQKLATAASDHHAIQNRVDLGLDLRGIDTFVLVGVIKLFGSCPFIRCGIAIYVGRHDSSRNCIVASKSSEEKSPQRSRVGAGR